MILLTSKWFIGLVIIIMIITLLIVFGRKSVHTEILIPAKPEQVWSVLTDTKNYDQWNKILTPIDGELRVGETVKYRFSQDADNSYEISSTVRAIIKNQLLNQGGGTTGILTFDHRYQLQQVDAGTKVVIHEDYRGIAVPFWNPAPVAVAYERLNQALKERVLKVFHNE